MASSIYSLVYRSYARPPWMGERTLGEIAAEAQAYNATHGVTGVLLFSGGVFVQALEGETVSVLQLTARIAADRRNERLRVLWHANIPERRFPDWSMGCFDTTSLSASETPMPPGLLGSDHHDPTWSAAMSERLIAFYRDNHSVGVAPVFNHMRRLT